MGLKIEKAGMEGVEEIAELYVPLSPLKFDALLLRVSRSIL
jgi:hypothetical protein